MRMILDLFDGGHSVTVYGDAGFTSVTADETTDVAKDTEVTVTPEVKTGYELAGYEVIAGGVELTVGDDGEATFDMGEDDVVIMARSKTGDNYMITEEVLINVNDNPIRLHKNAKVVLTPNGVPKAVNVESGGTQLAMSPAVQSLIDQGILIRI